MPPHDPIPVVILARLAVDRFYRHYGFEEFPGGSLRLMLTLGQIRAAMGGGADAGV